MAAWRRPASTRIPLVSAIAARTSHRPAHRIRQPKGRATPLYEYRCSACGETFEQLRRTQDADHGLVCPTCQSGEVRRPLSVFASRLQPHGGL
ncbi:MAG: zinc ribbon domain-containing protein [Bryobacteraceae bacterium]